MRHRVERGTAEGRAARPAFRARHSSAGAREPSKIQKKGPGGGAGGYEASAGGTAGATSRRSWV
ncbi:unnamed protein product [Streptomyces laurentii]|uniref:Uncharacterized protein n=1 Tax=Streptomyces laurentii TaxID=39478 RepID=A0A160NX44_STRLU|nr:unnamed protein product [Streptomyces laurentii]